MCIRDSSCPVLASIDYLLAPGDPVRDGAHDEVALKALEALIPFGRETQDWKTFLELLEEARKIAASTSAVSRIEENLTVLRENLRIDRENRLQGICFFCEERPTEKIFEIEVPMHCLLYTSDVYKRQQLGQLGPKWSRQELSLRILARHQRVGR